MLFQHQLETVRDVFKPLLPTLYGISVVNKVQDKISQEEKHCRALLFKDLRAGNLNDQTSRSEKKLLRTRKRER